MINIFNKIYQFFKDIDNEIIKDALDECDYIGAIIASKIK